MAKGPARTESLYDKYLARFSPPGDFTQHNLNIGEMLTREQFYDPDIIPWPVRRFLATTADPTFRGKNGSSHCIKKSTSVLRS